MTLTAFYFSICTIYFLRILVTIFVYVFALRPLGLVCRIATLTGLGTDVSKVRRGRVGKMRTCIGTCSCYVMGRFRFEDWTSAIIHTSNFKHADCLGFA